METWVPRVEALGHEVIFYQGDSNEVRFDEKHKMLYLTEDDSYDYPQFRIDKTPSKMAERNKAAIRWALKNREFDYIWRTDDGSYVNAYMLPDFYKAMEGYDSCLGYTGGAGMVLSRKLCEQYLDFKNELGQAIDDNVMFTFCNSVNAKQKWMPERMGAFYVAGEKMITLHYTNGRRQYLVDDIMSYYYTGNPIQRKVMLDYPIGERDAGGIMQKVNSYDCESGITPFWYNFNKDINNWEYYGQQPRSIHDFFRHNPFGEKSMHMLVMYKTEFKEYINILSEYIKCIQSGGNLNLVYNNNAKELDEVKHWLEENFMSYRTGTNVSLKAFFDMECVKDENCSIITVDA